MDPTRTVLIADDHPLFRAALRGALGTMLPGAVVQEAGTFAALKTAVTRHPDLDLILLDLDMPGTRGFASLLWLRGAHPAVPIVIVSGQSQPATMRRALDFGASGFIPKSVEPAVMAQAVRTVLDGGVWVPAEIGETADQDAEQEHARRIASLTPQQFRVLMMVADGLLNKQIAHEIDVTEATVKVHIAAIMRKLGLFRRTQLAVLAQRLMLAQHASLQVDDDGGADEDQG
ncbi:MAG TPA: response regulator transcription factor [Verrucomicrobiae bacterium]|nr:response regulator transcription factor [Verrucomicrobiae bacterium]